MKDTGDLLQISVKLPPNLHQEIVTGAQKTNRTISSFTRIALRNYLQTLELLELGD